jgi:hypothetical protein
VLEPHHTEAGIENRGPFSQSDTASTLHFIRLLFDPLRQEE